MKCRRFFDRFQFGAAMASGILALAVIAAVASAARAAGVTDSFTVKIAEKQQALSDPTNETLQHFLMWDLSADRIMARNMPYLELKNDSTSASPITEFHLTIGDTRFHFDCSVLHACAMLGKSTPGIDLSSTVSAISGNSQSTSGDQLNLAIGNGGLQPGQAVRFKIALGVDSGFNFYAHPDFRTVLFQMNGIHVYDGNLIHDGTTDNAQLTALYKLASGATVTAGPTPLVDTAVPGLEGLYYNSKMRHYGVMEPVDTFVAAGSVAAVPEPSSMLLALLGVTGLASLARRRRS